jgi:hypothetical protein
MDELSEEDEWFSLPERSQRQFTEAIALVLRDADAILGKSVVTHVVDTGEEALMREIGPDVERPPGYLMILGHPGGGLAWSGYGDTWPSYVVSAAESIQQSVMEDDYYWGKPFPPCPVHPNHPLVPEGVDGRACWVCARGSIEPIEIGHLADSGETNRAMTAH